MGELIRATCHDPSAGAAEYAAEYAADKIKDQIKQSLADVGVNDDAAHEMSDYLTGQIKDQLSEFADAQGESAEDAAAPPKNEEEPAAAEPVITAASTKTIQPTASTQTKKTPQPTTEKTSPAVQKTSPSNAAKCDALDYVSVGSGKFVYDDDGSCGYEAVVHNSHPSNRVFVLLYTTSGKTTRYDIDPESYSGMAFSIKSPKQTYVVDWYAAVFDTAECLGYLRGVKIADYPSLGIRTQKVNYPTCGK